MNNMKFFDRPFVLPALFLGVSFLVGLGLVAWGISARYQGNTISVTGSTSDQVKADRATWSIDIRRTAYEGGTSMASDALTHDGKAIIAYLTSLHLASSTITSTVVNVSQDYAYDKNGNSPTTYTINQTITVTTSDVEMIDSLSHDMSALNKIVSPQTIVSPQQPQYYVSTLPALRVSLLGAAIKDAKARAEAIAQSGGSSVGPLESASSGVVQVLTPNSANVEGYGEYDTSTIDKEVVVIVHGVFYVK